MRHAYILLVWQTYSSIPGMTPLLLPTVFARLSSHSLRHPMANLRRRERWSASGGGIHRWTVGTGRRREWWKSGTSSCSTTFARRRDGLLCYLVGLLCCLFGCMLKRDDGVPQLVTTNGRNLSLEYWYFTAAVHIFLLHLCDFVRRDAFCLCLFLCDHGRDFREN